MCKSVENAHMVFIDDFAG